MASSLPNPTALSITTRLPPQHARTFSRSKSPERSPARKAQFAARELDPLLQSLSPDSTLEALQKTNTIAGSQAEQNALAKSISDASESERRLGIRAAIAAKNLKEWNQEVSLWPWPAREDRPWGAGFIPPTNKRGDNTTYCGSLPKSSVKLYEDRLDEIWDAIETLGMDDLKDYVFTFHNPRAPSVESPKSHPSSYGRMRDFTALITATVVQSLPVQANLLILLDTWSIRLSVLREVPDLLSRYERVKLGLTEINQIIQDPKVGRRLTKVELETAKVMFGNKVSNLCKRVDVLLDQLEGQEDSLPQPWLDQLDDIENKYAAWVAQAEQVVLRNQTHRDSPHILPSTNNPAITPSFSSTLPSLSESPSIGDAFGTFKPATLAQSPSRDTSIVRRKPLLEVNPNKNDQKHRRGFSEVSMADSTFSNYSLENAEIIDAVETKVMPSPRISVIDNQFSPSKNTITWMKGGTVTGLSPPRPKVLIQRASTASVELVPRYHVKEVTLRRSASHDLLSSTRKSPQSTLRSIVPLASAASVDATPQHGHQESTGSLPEVPGTLTPLATSPSPSLRVDPLSLRGKELARHTVLQRPLVPRRSSKRLSMPLLESRNRSPSPPQVNSTEAVTDPVNGPLVKPLAQPAEMRRQATFDDRLKSILASMPTKIRLTEGPDSGHSSRTTSRSSSRASSPVQELKLSPVKDSKSGRYQATTDIRVYHLSESGKSRDAPAIKLFVRAVGEHGERVMVRVGGGWADLAEYLREYSLHHGGRNLTERRLEVAGYPGGNTSKLLSSPLLTSSSLRGSPKIGPVSEEPRFEPRFDFGLPGRSIKHGNHANRSNTSLDLLNQTQNTQERPPPVPLIPSSHPLATDARGASPRNADDARSPTPANTSRPNSRISGHISTTPTATTPNHYTPLGAAGPVHSSRRATSYTYTLTPRNEVWVNGMVKQARAVSGSQTHLPHVHHTNSPSTNRHSTTIVTPTMTTTTTFTSRVRSPNSGPSSKRTSSMAIPTTPTHVSAPAPAPAVINTTPLKANVDFRPPIQPSPVGSELSQASSSSSSKGSTSKKLSKTKRPDSDGRRISIMSFGDVGGIRRVFLRKKSDKSEK